MITPRAASHEGQPRPGRFTPSARHARLAAAAQALLELATAREQATIRTIGVLPFDHASGKPRTTRADGTQIELFDAVCEEDDATLVDARRWLGLIDTHDPERASDERDAGDRGAS